MSNNGARNWWKPALCGVSMLVILAAPDFAYSRAIARFDMKERGLSITLHDGECKMKDQVTNLPKRAVWREAGNVFEGCWGVSTQFGMIFMYFSDKTATGIPVPFFEPISET